MKILKKSEGKIIPIIVTGDLKITVLKIALIDLIRPCAEDMLHVFDGKILEEEETLDELGIQNSCTINLSKPKKILIYIKTEDENEIPAVITSNIKVKKLSEIIQSALEYHINKQSLYFGSKLLKSNKTIFEQGIRHLSTIQLNINFIQDSELLEKTKFKPIQESVFLESIKTLTDQDAQSLSTLQSTACLLQHSQIESQNIKIYIKITLGEKLFLIVSNDMQIRKLIKLIRMNLHFNASGKALKFNGMTLDKEKTLKELGILNNSALSLTEIFYYYR